MHIGKKILKNDDLEHPRIKERCMSILLHRRTICQTGQKRVHRLRFRTSHKLRGISCENTDKSSLNISVEVTESVNRSIIHTGSYKLLPTSRPELEPQDPSLWGA